MTGAELYQSSDQNVWAAEFCRAAAENGFDPKSQDGIEWVAVWFANAMMRGHDDAIPPGMQNLEHRNALVAASRPNGE